MYHPDIRRDEQKETMLALMGINYYNIEMVQTIDPLDYEMAVKYNWNLGYTFFILEQDKVPTQEIIDEMALCEEPICVANYMLSAKKMGLDREVSAHRIITRGNPSHIEELRHVTTESYADLYGFGLVKITPFGRYGLTLRNWNGLDARVSTYTAMHAYKAHIHGMIKHNHS